MTFDHRTVINPRNLSGIESAIRSEFDHSSYRPLHKVQLRYDGQVMSVSGSLPSFHMKQVALNILKRHPASFAIDDRMHVSTD